MFLDVFFGVALGRVQDDFGAQHGPNLSPCWSHVYHFLVHIWVFFWHLNLRSLLKRFFVDFWSLFDSPDPQKHCPCWWFWGSLHLLHDRSWDRSWTDFGSILDTQIVPKSVPRGSRKVLEILVDFECLQDPPRINFWPTWSQHDSILPPKTAPSWSQNWTKIGSKTASGAKSAPEQILGRFWSDFGSILGRCWFEFGWIFGMMFGLVLCRCYLEF